MQPDDHRHGRRRSVFEIKIAAHAMAKVDWYPVYAPGRPPVVRHQTRLGVGKKFLLVDRRQSLRCLAKRPFDAFDGGSVLGDGQAGCILQAAPLFPVEVVDQLLGKVSVLGQAAAKSQVDPIEITLPISPADLFRRRAGGVATGAVINPKILLHTEELINRAAFDVGLLDGEGRLGAVVVGGVNEAVARCDQGIPAVGINRQFILAPGEVAQ